MVVELLFSFFVEFPDTGVWLHRIAALNTLIWTRNIQFLKSPAVTVYHICSTLSFHLLFLHW
jgi:hypothetical protein